MKWNVILEVNSWNGQFAVYYNSEGFFKICKLYASTKRLLIVTEVVKAREQDQDWHPKYCTETVEL
jgi:hypothetical protein